MISRKLRFPLRLKSGLLRTARVRRGSLMDVYLINNTLPYSQAAIIVGKNVSVKAVRRNYLKRVSFEVMQKEILPFIQQSLVVRLKAKSNLVSYREIKYELEQLVAKN